jgi:hypothetical protein
MGTRYHIDIQRAPWTWKQSRCMSWRSHFRFADVKAMGMLFAKRGPCDKRKRSEVR